MRKPRIFCFLWLAFVLAANGAEHRAASALDIARVAEQLRPGDTVILADGNWVDQALVLRGKGSADKPITYRAASPGKVVLSGQSSVSIEGEHVVVRGIFLNDCTAPGDGVKLAGTHCRLTESAVIGGQHKSFVHFFGLSNRMDHCYLADKTNDSPTLQIEVGPTPNHHLLDYNHFGPRPPLRRNGGETIRVGYSHQSLSNSATRIEHNLFERCDGEIEIISSKSCGNSYRFNTFRECAGMFTLRHGNGCLVDGNFFIGNHKRGSGGIRIIGENHTIINNYIEGVENGGFWLTAGMTEPALVEYFQVTNCLIAFNTFVDSRGPALQLDAGYRAPRRVLRPKNVTIANNVFALRGDGKLFTGTEGEDFKWMGNIANVAPDGAKGIRVADLKLERAPDGLWRAAADSPVRDATAGNFPQVKTDMDGQPRTGKFDAGSDQISTAPIALRPLTAADVGPTWRRSAAASARP
jgi:poly(beta-D-mannuronate) lyase